MQLALCGARTRSGEPCRAHAMPNGRCRMHGGKALAGAASPSLKAGRYSKYLPDGLLERYEAALKDRDLLNLRDEIALVEARIGHLLQPGEDEHTDWAEVAVLINERRKLVDTERKRLVAMQQMITAEQATLLVVSLVGIIREHVHDPRILAAIQHDLNGLLAARNERAAGAG